MEHLGTHYSDKCTLCEFTGQNVQDLRNHLQDVHGICDIQDLSDPQDNNSDYQDDDETPNKRGKSKSFKCKQCNYVTTTKLDFWEHSKGHIKAEKLLTCPKCPFVTEYKHHLEYHLRNHFGSKPFKCSKCPYTCVNKSMLNSHLKSHSNVYQYRCSDCAYATKYCHSLKLHLRKYEHKPAMVLNADGSPNPLPIIDIYGTRRGPKQKSNKSEDGEEKNAFLDIKVPHKDKCTPNLPGGIIVPNAPQISPKSPNSLIYPLNNNDIKESSQNGMTSKFFYCTICEFHTISPDILNQHMFLHAAETNLAHILKTNNNLQDQSLMKDYLQNVFLSHPLDQPPFIDTRSMSPMSLVSPKVHSPSPKPPISPLDLSKQDNCESESEVFQERKRKSDETEPKKESTKHRRKGKAYKLERVNERLDSSPENFYNKTEDQSYKIKIPEFKTKMEPEVETKSEKVKVAGEEKLSEGKDSYSCIYCDIAFKDIIMYTMHMGYHGYQDPFTCNMCGHITVDKVSFFLHIARSSHS